MTEKQCIEVAVEAICRDIPDGCGLAIECESGYAGISLVGLDGEIKEFEREDEEAFGDYVERAIVASRSRWWESQEAP